MATIPIEKLIDTPLIAALRGGDTSTAKRLISEPTTDVNEKGPFNNTPLMWATVNGCKESVQMLIERHVEVNARNDEGSSALDLIKYCAVSGTVHAEIAKILIENGAEKNGRVAAPPSTIWEAMEPLNVLKAPTEIGIRTGDGATFYIRNVVEIRRVDKPAE